MCALRPPAEVPLIYRPYVLACMHVKQQKRNSKMYNKTIQSKR